MSEGAIRDGRGNDPGDTHAAVLREARRRWAAADRAVTEARRLIEAGWPEQAMPMLLKALVWRPDHADSAEQAASALEMMGEFHAADVARRRSRFLRSDALIPPPPVIPSATAGQPALSPPQVPPHPRHHRWSPGRALTWLIEGCRKAWAIRRPRMRLILEIAAVLLIRAVKPIIRIRFGGLRVDRIGHFCIETDLYLGERRAGFHGPRTWDAMFFETVPCNAVLAGMARRRIGISPIFRSLGEVNGCFKGAGLHQVFSVSRQLYRSQDREEVLVNAPPFLTLSRREREEGARRLRQLGIPEGAPYICFHVRDAAYPTQQFGTDSSQIQHHRNGDIEDYLPAVERLTARGFYAIRVGNRVERPLCNGNPRVIDYASTAPCDLMDIYLPMNCTLFLGSTSGLLHVARLARKPILLSNFLPLQLMPPATAGDLVIPKSVFRRGEAAPLSLQALIENDFHTFLIDEEYERAGLVTAANTPEEIAEAAEELALREAGEWQDGPEDESRQALFNTTIRRTALIAGDPVCRIASSYLRRNPWFLAGL